MASGQLLRTFHPVQTEPPSTNYAILYKATERWCLEYSGTSSRGAMFTSILPAIYSGGGITVRIWYTTTSSVTGDIDWDVSFERIDDVQDLTASGFASSISSDGNALTSKTPKIVDIACTDGAQIDSIEIGELFRFRLERDAPSDGCTATARVWGIGLFET